MLAQEFCPDCGLPRGGLFRFCLSCGLDYDLLDATFEPPGGPFSPVPPGGWPVAGFVTRTRPVRHDRALVPAGRRATRQAEPMARRRRGRRLGTFAFLSLGVVLGLSAAAWASTTDLPARVAAVAAGLIVPGPSSGAGAIAQATPSPVPSTTPAPSPTPAPVVGMRPSPDAVEASVVGVLDGSTIFVDLDGQTVRVRYLGVDVPEAAGSATSAVLATRATQVNAQLVGGRTAYLETGPVDTDEGGRLIRRVWIEKDGRFVLAGLWLVWSGVAEVSTTEPDPAYAGLYEAAQDSARQLAIGVWTPTSAELPATGPTPGPSSGPAVTVPLRDYTSVEPIIVPSDGLVRIEGILGRYTWRTVNFSSVSTRLDWSVVARGRAECTVHWTLTAQDGEVSEGTITTKGPKDATGKVTVATTAAEASLVVESTCPDWTFGLRGLEP
jgi:endonuclease YncB( thermonuclease family)